MSFTYIPSRQPFLKTWGNENIAAVLELGALIGALIAGVYADHYSRRRSIVFACSTSVFLNDVSEKTSHTWVSFFFSHILYWLCFPMQRPAAHPSVHRSCLRWSRSWCSQVRPFISLQVFFKPTLYNKSQYALSSLHGGNKPSGSTRFTHGSRTTLHRARCRIWVLDRLYYSF